MRVWIGRTAKIVNDHMRSTVFNMLILRYIFEPNLRCRSGAVEALRAALSVVLKKLSVGNIRLGRLLGKTLAKTLAIV